jgi:hypothetical protein
MVRPALTSSTTDNHLDHDQQVAGAAAVRSCTGAATRLECLGEIRRRRLQRRYEAEHDARQQRHAKRKHEHGNIDGDPRLVRHVELRHQPDNGTNRAEREQHPKHTTGKREQDTLRQKLAQQPAAAGANRHPDRHLARPCRTAGQLQVGDVCARDEEQERHRPEEQPQTRLHFAARDRHIQIVPQGGGEALRRKHRRLRQGQPLVERAQLLPGNGLRHVRRQPHDWIDPRDVRAGGRQREPESTAAIPAEARRHDPDDRVWTAVQPQNSADG